MFQLGRKRRGILGEPSGKPQGSDQPRGCSLERVCAAPLEPRRERRGSDQPQKRAALGSLLLKPPGKGQGRGRVEQSP
jgi:hypothetical protein